MRRAALLLALFSGCTCGVVHVGPGSDAGNDAGGDAGGGGGGGGGGGAGGGGGGAGADGGCRGANECDGGVCVAGACCASAAQVCGTACCASATVCLFERCVTPGSDCHTANDCARGEYCETGLATDGGAAVDGGTCTQPLPQGGKCLARPPVCDGGLSADAGCVEACEYRADAGQLNAVARWTWGPNTAVKPGFIDVWSTPAVGRIVDANCDGRVDALDPPDVVFVSGRGIDSVSGRGTCCQCTGATTSACQTGVLRVVDGRTGQDLWSLEKASASSVGFAGSSVAIGDVDNDASLDIVAVTGEGLVVLIDARGVVKRTSTQAIPGHGIATFGWGGGLALADMDHDGFTEIAFGSTVFTTTGNAITLRFTGSAGLGGGGIDQALSTFVDLDGVAGGTLELLAGNTAYTASGATLWNRSDLADGFSGVGDFDKDGTPEAVLVTGGTVTVLNGRTGTTALPAATLGGTGAGGPPTVADFDGDGKPEIGVAQATFYSVLKPNFAANRLDLLWQKPNHDLSSSVTGSSVFDFEGDGRAEVIYADECFLWVFDGPTGAVRFASSHTSFTATEASLVADVDGDGRAEMLMVSNGADPSNNGWKCLNAAGSPAVINGVTWVPGPAAGQAYRGLVLFGDSASSWVGTRTLWNQHTYHVSNICDDRDSACVAPNTYGSIPRVERKNWTVPWLNNFRQNVQDHGLFDAPDPAVSLAIECTTPAQAHVSVRNLGLASLPSGVDVGVFRRTASGDTSVGQVATTHPLTPGQTQELLLPIPAASGVATDTFVARVLINPANPRFHQCRPGNDESAPATAVCIE